VKRAAAAMKRKVDVQWKKLEKQVRQVWVRGDPKTPGAEFVVRYQAKVRLHIPPHWHPGDEHVTVLAGKFAVARGRTYNSKKLRPLRTGSYVCIPARQPHFSWFERGALVQIHGTGPFKTNCV